MTVQAHPFKTIDNAVSLVVKLLAAVGSVSVPTVFTTASLCARGGKVG